MIFTFNNRAVRKKIFLVEAARQQRLSESLPDLRDRLFLASTFKVSTPARKDILAVTIKQSLAQFKNSGVKVRVVDASLSEFLEENRRVFADIFGSFLEYKAAEKRMPEVFAELLAQANEKYCMCIFDDIPLVNFSPEYLQAACKLLDDYAGVVDIVAIWPVLSELDQEKKQIILHGHKDIREELGNKLLGVVKYGNFSFAIVENFFYGFSLLNFMAPCRDYLNRLKWYMKHVSAVSPQKIEKVSMWHHGPGYKYLAIPLEVSFLDIDYERTEGSIRSVDPKQKEFYLALKNGYNIIVK
jgi:hypothetical protein